MTATLIILFLVFCLVRRLMRSPFGLALSGVRQNPRRMLMIGTSVRRHVIVVYTISAAIAGIAGGLLAQTTQFVGLDSIGVERSADVLVMPDGALLVSDDLAGAIYRITWSKP